MAAVAARTLPVAPAAGVPVVTAPPPLHDVVVIIMTRATPASSISAAGWVARTASRPIIRRRSRDRAECRADTLLPLPLPLPFPFPCRAYRASKPAPAGGAPKSGVRSPISSTRPPPPPPRYPDPLSPTPGAGDDTYSLLGWCAFPAAAPNRIPPLLVLAVPREARWRGPPLTALKPPSLVREGLLVLHAFVPWNPMRAASGPNPSAPTELLG